MQGKKKIAAAGHICLDITPVFPANTAGTVAAIPKSLFSSGRTLAVHMYVLASEGLHVDQAYATAVVLLVLVIVINALSSFLAKKIQKS